MSEAFLPIAILFGGIFVFIAMGMEIGIALGSIAAIMLVLFTNQPLQQFLWTSFSSMNVFSLTCVPLFVFMGGIFSYTGVVAPLFNGIERIFRKLPGALLISVIVANASFGAMSGSSVAAAATFGRISFPALEERGYDPKLSLGALAISGTLSVLIPPSVILVVYGSWLGLSIVTLFAAALIPGVMLSLLLILTVVIKVKINPSLAPGKPPVIEGGKLRAIRDVVPWVGIIAIILGTIFAGIMTPTEAASLGAFLSIVAALAYRRMSYRALMDSALDAVKISSMLGLLTVGAYMVAHTCQFLGVIDVIASAMLGVAVGKTATLAILCVIYVILGMFFDAFSMLLLTLPFLTPVLNGLGVNLIWWGVVYVVLAQIGMLTPPFGLVLFTLRNVIPKYDIPEIVQGVLIFFIPTLALIALLIAFPQLCLWLPTLMGR